MSQPATRFPSGATYVDALQNTSLCFRDTKLVDAGLKLDKLGRPRAISGAFASVFSVTATTGHRYAVKCFTREVADQEIRYRAISDHLASLSYDWKVDFEYVSEGILVEGKRYPILTMEWVEADTLTRWIDNHLHEPLALTGLADRFVTLVGELAAAGIGHGDLQHGNLLVTQDGAIRLVDYDGMYVPALAGRPAAENGHRNYQPPNRSGQDFGPAVDRFSEWVVYLSLFAVGVDPSLWRQLRDSSAEQLLLAEEDFRAPASSFRLSALLGHTEPTIRTLAQNFTDLLNQPLSAMPVITPVMTPSVPALSISRSGAQGLPSWMTDHVAPNTLVGPQLAFAHRSVSLRYCGFLTFALLVVGAAALVILGPVGLALLAISVVSVAAWLGCAAISYRKQPESREASAARVRNSDATKHMTSAGKALSTLDQLTHRMNQADADRQATQTKRHQQLVQQHERKRVAEQHGIQQQLTSVDADLRNKAVQRDKTKQSELARLQNMHVHSYLASQPISSAKISGISTTLTANLRAAGIATAADFIRFEYSQNKVIFQLANQGWVQVPGIGEAKAGRLLFWRDELMTRAQASQPTTLPSGTTRAIDDQHAASVAVLRTERQRLADSVAKSQARFTAELNLDRTDLIDQFRRENTAAAQLRAGHEQQLTRARQSFDTASQEKRSMIYELSAYQRISYRSYLRTILFGVR